MTVLYLAETPEHAIAEKLQVYRGQTVGDAELHEFGHRLTLARITPEGGVDLDVPDLCRPETLAERGIQPDELAAASRSTTRAIAERLWRGGASGLRWWSALRGEWHTVVLFDPPPLEPRGPASVVPPDFRLLYDRLTPLTPATPEALRAAREIGIILS